MLSNDNWILSMVIKSYKNDISYSEQLLLDIEYISTENSNLI